MRPNDGVVVAKDEPGGGSVSKGIRDVVILNLAVLGLGGDLIPVDWSSGGRHVFGSVAKAEISVGEALCWPWQCADAPGKVVWFWRRGLCCKTLGVAPIGGQESGRRSRSRSSRWAQRSSAPSGVRRR